VVKLDQIPNPQHIDIERNVLGCLLTASKFNEDADDYLKHLDGSMFYDPRHRTIYEAVLKTKAPDLITVTETMRDEHTLERIGGAGFLMGLAIYVPDSINMPYYASVLRNRAMRRGLIKVAQIAITDAVMEGVDPTDLIDEIMTKLQKIVESNRVETVDTAVIVPALEARRAAVDRGELHLIPSGIVELDEMMRGGFATGYNSYIKGAPGKGKTALMLQMLDSMVDMGQRVLLISLEMPREDVWPRVIASRLYRLGLVFNNFDYSCLWNTGKWIAGKPDLKVIENYSKGWFIDDTRPQGPGGIIRSINEHVKHKGVRVVAIDHLNKITHDEDHTQKDKEDFIEHLSTLARVKKIVIISLVQQHTSGKNEGGEYYYKTARQDAAVGLEVKMKEEGGDAMVEMFKNRFGPWGQRKFKFLGGVQTFEQLGGGGYHVPQTNYMDGLEQGGDSKGEGQGDRGDNKAGEMAGEEGEVIRGKAGDSRDKVASCEDGDDAVAEHGDLGAPAPEHWF